MLEQARRTVDGLAIGATWGQQVFYLPNIYSLWYSIIGGDCMIRWAPIPTGSAPDFNVHDVNGEVLPAGQYQFDRLDNRMACWQFQLAPGTSAAILSFKAQARMLGGGGISGPLPAGAGLAASTQIIQPVEL